MSGTQARPAPRFLFSAPPRGGANARRLGTVALAVVALHVGVLTLRPGVASGNFVPASAAAVMAVRMVIAPPAASPPPVALPAIPPAGAPPPPAVERPNGDATNTRSNPEPMPVPAPRAANTHSEPMARSAPVPVSAADEARSAVASLAAAPDYAFGIRLDPGPRPLDDIEPDYPDTLHLREGVVVLRLLIGATGHVDDVAVVRAEPPGIFEQAAIEAFAKARFSPGLAAGVPVKSQIMVEVQFMPINRGARVSGRTY